MSKKFTVTLSRTVFYTTNVEAETIGDAFGIASDMVRHGSDDVEKECSENLEFESISRTDRKEQ